MLLVIGVGFFLSHTQISGKHFPPCVLADFREVFAQKCLRRTPGFLFVWLYWCQSGKYFDDIVYGYGFLGIRVLVLALLVQTCIRRLQLGNALVDECRLAFKRSTVAKGLV